MNLISKLMNKEFCVMVINEERIFSTPNVNLGNIYLKQIKRNKLISLQRYIKKGYVIVLEVDHQRCLVFTDLSRSNVFYNLQRRHKCEINYVFCGNKTGGYFKILENGRIKRKIASFLEINSVHEYPDILGEPCEAEIKQNKIYHLDTKATYMKDQLYFTKKEVLELFHYYIGDEKKMSVSNITIYSFEWLD